MKPCSASGSARRSSSMATVSSSGTYSPAAMIACTLRPNSVPAAAWSRNISPVETWGTPSSWATRLAWVPLPAPGGPPNKSLILIAGRRPSSEDPFVVSHRELGFDLLHRLQCDPDHDQDRDPGEGDRDAPDRTCDSRKHCDNGQEDRSGQCDPIEDEREVLRSLTTGADSWDETSLTLDHLRLLLGIELNGGVEVGEEDDQGEENQDVPPGHG